MAYSQFVYTIMFLLCACAVDAKKRRTRNNSPKSDSPVNPKKSWLHFQIKNLATSYDRDSPRDNTMYQARNNERCRCSRGPPGPSGPRGPPGAEVTEAYLMSKFRALIRTTAERRSGRIRETSDQAMALMATGVADLVSAFHIELKNNIQVPKKSMVELRNYKTNVGQYGTFIRGDDINFRSGQFTVPYTAIYRFSSGVNIARFRDASLRPRDMVKVLICINFQCNRNTSLMTVSGLSSNSRVFTIRVEGLLSLKAGQHVSVYIDNNSSNPVVVQSRSTFTGVLIGI
ncbi:adipolin-like [Xenia sp. Carnegie-2017]|uniref:adipolin-like n=1 Tax=Xenia sp. Carnegie-2017 TaxID=2897299 RepID=UPI001F03FB53|nr:adipolin-like [Xenia sp. Carnegie-2017]